MNKNSTEIQKKHKVPYKNLLVISIVTVVVLIFAVYFGAFSMFLKLNNYLGAYHLDEIFTVLVVLAFAFGIFSFPRWRNLKNEDHREKTIGSREKKNHRGIAASDGQH